MKNPLGTADSYMTSEEIVQAMVNYSHFLKEDLTITKRGKEFVMAKLEKMSQVERIMIERFILEHHACNG